MRGYNYARNCAMQPYMPIATQPCTFTGRKCGVLGAQTGALTTPFYGTKVPINALLRLQSPGHCDGGIPGFIALQRAQTCTNVRKRTQTPHNAKKSIKNNIGRKLYNELSIIKAQKKALRYYTYLQQSSKSESSLLQLEQRRNCPLQNEKYRSEI